MLTLLKMTGQSTLRRQRGLLRPRNPLIVDLECKDWTVKDVIIHRLVCKKGVTKEELTVPVELLGSLNSAYEYVLFEGPNLQEAEKHR